jgi:hypothetical protein
MPPTGTPSGPRFRRRDDYAIELFREIREHFRELPRVSRHLLELGRFYNPVTNGAIVDLATRRRILELLEAERDDEARQLLDERLALYARMDEDEPTGASAGNPREVDGGTHP